MDDLENNKPFSRSYVLRLTLKHIRKAIDVSIRKTFARVEELKGDENKSSEVFETLAMLHAIRKLIDDFQLANKDKLTGV